MTPGFRVPSLTHDLTLFAHISLIVVQLTRNKVKINRKSSKFFSSKCRLSSYASETNVVAKVIESIINRTPCIALDKPVEISTTCVFHPFLENTPQANRCIGIPTWTSPQLFELRRADLPFFTPVGEKMFWKKIFCKTFYYWGFMESAFQGIWSHWFRGR
jgi:hypothetical protein